MTARVCWRTLHQTLCFVSATGQLCSLGGWANSHIGAGDVRGLSPHPPSDSPRLNRKSSVMVLVLWGTDIRTREEGPVSAQQKRTEIPGGSIVLSMRGERPAVCGLQYKHAWVSCGPGIALHRLHRGPLTHHCLHEVGHLLWSGSAVPLGHGHGFLLGTLLCNG